MKKEYFAAAFLLFLIFCGLANGALFQKQSCLISRILSSSAAAAAEGNSEKALGELSSAFSRFRKFKSYASLFMNGSQLRELENAFLNLRAALGGKNYAEMSAAYTELLYMLDEAAQMQKLKFYTVF